MKGFYSLNFEAFPLFPVRILDISFNVLRHIEGLDQLVQLKKLFLVNNKISKIENLSNLQQLQILELGSNRIRVGISFSLTEVSKNHSEMLLIKLVLSNSLHHTAAVSATMAFRCS